MQPNDLCVLCKAPCRLLLCMRCYRRATEKPLPIPDDIPTQEPTPLVGAGMPVRVGGVYRF